jgi:hypothetical protein
MSAAFVLTPFGGCVKELCAHDLDRLGAVESRSSLSRRRGRESRAYATRRSASRASRSLRDGSHRPQARPGLPRSSPGRLNHSCDPAPTRRSLARGHGGTRSVAAARLGSGRSRPVGPRTRIRLEAQAQATAVIPPHGSVQSSLPTSLWKLWKTFGLWSRTRIALGSQAARSGDFTTCHPVWDHSKGGRSPKSSERARTSEAAGSSPRRSRRASRSGSSGWPRLPIPFRRCSTRPRAAHLEARVQRGLRDVHPLR